MKQIYLYISVFLVLLIIVATFFVEIPTPSKKISEKINIEIQ